MLLPFNLFALPFLASLLACTSAQDEGSKGDPEQATPPASQSTGGDSADPSIQLAQYPGAPLEDRNGHLWFNTVLKGLIRYDGKEFVTFTMADGLPSNGIRDAIEDDDGTLWFGTTGGVSLYDGKTFKTLTDYGDIPVKSTFGQGGDHRDIWDLLKDRHGNWWIATAAGVFRYNGTSFTPFPLPVTAGPGAYEFTPNMVYSIFEDKAGVLWFGTDGAGAVSYDGTDFTPYTAKSNGLCSDRICTIFQDSRGTYWFGTSDGGVSRFDGTTFTTHLRSETHSIHTGWGRFMSIVEDRDANVWFGRCSAGGGVHRYDGKTFRYYSTADGLGPGGVPSIDLDRQGNLWFGTTSGVYRFDGERFVNFTKRG